MQDRNDVLCINVKKINEDFSAIYIAYQNYKALPRDEFYDSVINAGSYFFPSYSSISNKLYLRGSMQEQDKKPFIVRNKYVSLIEEKVDAINKKYGIPKRWRAKDGERYYLINMYGLIESSIEKFWKVDNNAWECGNYFKSFEDAENSKLYKLFEEMKNEGGI